MTQLSHSTVPETAIPDPDTDLLALVARHDALWAACESDVATVDAVHELCQIEKVIAVTPAYTHSGLAGKNHVISRAEFSPAVMDIVRESLRLDVERCG